MLVTLLTVQDVAQRWQSKDERVLAAIATKDLIAMDISPKGSKRPTWRITPEALDAYERLRTTVAPVKPATRRRSADRSVTKFF